MSEQTGPSPVRVLLADDDEVFLGLLAALLDHTDAFEVVGRARNGAEAVGLAAALQPEVVLMDVDLPLLDGIEAAGLIRQGEPTTRIVLVSGSQFAEIADEAMGALEAGAMAYVPKTRVADDLLDTLSTLGRFGSAHPESAVA
jgi:two-component system nitrate/nitrite response regulator NarL